MQPLRIRGGQVAQPRQGEVGEEAAAGLLLAPMLTVQDLGEGTRICGWKPTKTNDFEEVLQQYIDIGTCNRFSEICDVSESFVRVVKPKQ